MNSENMEYKKKLILLTLTILTLNVSIKANAINKYSYLGETAEDIESIMKCAVYAEETSNKTEYQRLLKLAKKKSERLYHEISSNWEQYNRSWAHFYEKDINPEIMDGGMIFGVFYQDVIINTRIKMIFDIEGQGSSFSEKQSNKK